jgi:cell division septation protein DedD
VTDLTHDGSEDGFHEIQLSGKQLVFLFMATTVVSVVIFLCGVLVGRSVRLDRTADVDPVAASAPAPTDTVAVAAPAAAEPPVPAEDADPSLTYKQRLEGDKPPADALKPSDAAKPTTSAPLAIDDAPPPPRKEATTPSARQQRPAATNARDGWVVQIAALRDRQTANAIVERLSGKGYPAFLVSPTAGAPAPVFKVQVGRYADKEQAEQIRRRLEKEEQFKPWISR